MSTILVKCDILKYMLITMPGEIRVTMYIYFPLPSLQIYNYSVTSVIVLNLDTFNIDSH